MAYNKKTWISNEIITKDALNNIENGIESIEKEIPTKISQLVNDSNFLTDQQAMDNYVTQNQIQDMQKAIEELQEAIRVIEETIARLDQDFIDPK